eukprot:380431-Prymnesium_polylepis.2
MQPRTRLDSNGRTRAVGRPASRGGRSPSSRRETAESELVHTCPRSARSRVAMTRIAGGTLSALSPETRQAYAGHGGAHADASRCIDAHPIKEAADGPIQLRRLAAADVVAVVVLQLHAVDDDPYGRCTLASQSKAKNRRLQLVRPLISRGAARAEQNVVDGVRGSSERIRPQELERAIERRRRHESLHGLPGTRG